LWYLLIDALLRGVDWHGTAAGSVEIWAAFELARQGIK
jgi:hypothetical protein